MEPSPCCAATSPSHVRELIHVYQFDFDLFQCPICLRHWVHAWREGQGGWEAVTSQDVESMQLLKGDELRTFMKSWARAFN